MLTLTILRNVNAKCAFLYLGRFQGNIFISVRRASSARCFRTFQFFDWRGSGRGRRAARPALGHKVASRCFDRLFLKVTGSKLTVQLYAMIIFG